MSETISRILLQQRIRNRIIEVLELCSSFEDVARFGAFEVINMWEDWVEDPAAELFTEPVFSELERAAITRFHTVWDLCAEQTDEDIFDAQALSELDHWCAFRASAQSALKLFENRGRFAEDEEEF